MRRTTILCFCFKLIEKKKKPHIHILFVTIQIVASFEGKHILPLRLCNLKKKNRFFNFSP